MSATGPTTLRDIARLVGVSVATVSSALNESGRVSEQTRARVLQAAEALNYVPNLAARSLHRARTNVIGVMLGHPSPASFEIVTGINVRGREQGRQMLIATTEIDPDDEQRRIRDLASGLADGIVLIAPISSPERLRPLANLDIPVVLANYRRHGSGLPVVYGENVRAAREITEHLVALGHERIAFVTGTSGSGQSAERERGFRLALAGAGLSLDERFVIPGDFSAQSGERAAEVVLAYGADGPTAVFGANDQIAAGLIDGFTARGLRVPDDYSVVGFDGAPMQRVVPELTTIAHPFRGIGHAAADLLDRLIAATPEDRAALADTAIELPSRLEVHDSSAAPRSAE